MEANLDKQKTTASFMAMVLPFSDQPGTSSVLTAEHPSLGGYSPSG